MTEDRLPVTTAASTPSDGTRTRPERGYWSHAAGDLLRDWAAVLGLVIVIGLCACALLAPVLAPYEQDYQHREGLSLEGEPLPPSATFPFGTDAFGRDELSRVLYGARVSLLVGIGGTLLAATIGLILGTAAGASRGLPQTLIMRSVDVILSFPVLLLAVALLAVTKPSLPTMLIIFGVAFGANIARIVFGQVVSLREREFVLAAELAGVSRRSIAVRHIVPHVMPSVVVYGTLGVATAIMFEAALSYVGIGIQPPQASWGNMISDGQASLFSSPWLVAFPGAAIVLAMIGFSLLGDGLRDVLDPTLERRGRLLTGIR
jgi:peptide/nickel transport system permease protein